MATDGTRTTSLRVVGFTVVGEMVSLLEHCTTARGHRLVGLVTAPGPRSRRSDEYRSVVEHARPGLDVIISNYPNRWADMIRPLRPDLIFCIGFNWKIPADVLEVPRFGAINFHDSLLPKNRGRNAIGWALRTGDDWGLSIHAMTPELDEGPVLAQQRIPITDDVLGPEMIMPKVMVTADRVIQQALDAVASGEPGIPQDQTLVTYSPGAFEPEWRYIDWSRPARDVFVQVRSWCGIRGLPRGAFGEIDGRQALITTTRLLQEPSAGVPQGEILDRRPDGSLVVQCGDGPLEVLEWAFVEADQESTTPAA